jgi:hypothetical protein
MTTIPNIRTDGLDCLVSSEWIAGEGLWRVGFTLQGLPLIQLMSGLVEILETAFVPGENAVVFIVRPMDVTGTIFRKGSLKATPIQRYRLLEQPLIVQSSVTHLSSSVIN